MFRRLSNIVLSKMNGVSTGFNESGSGGVKTEGVSELELQQLNTASDIEGQTSSPVHEDAFGNEEGAEIQYKTCIWW